MVARYFFPELLSIVELHANNQHHGSTVPNRSVNPQAKTIAVFRIAVMEHRAVNRKGTLVKEEFRLVLTFCPDCSENQKQKHPNKDYHNTARLAVHLIFSFHCDFQVYSMSCLFDFK